VVAVVMSHLHLHLHLHLRLHLRLHLHLHLHLRRSSLNCLLAKRPLISTYARSPTAH